MEVDPLASMRCWAIEIQLGGRTFEVPALPAVDWWPVLISGDLGQVLDFILSDPDDPSNIDELLLSGTLTREELAEALTDAVEEAAGRSFHAALVIATVAVNHWGVINGTLAQCGFRWDEQPLGAALDAIYAVVVGRLDKEALDKFMAVLDNEALTSGARREKNQDKAVADFEALAGPRPTSGVVASGEQSGSGPPRTRPRSRPRLPDDRSGEPKRPRVRRAGSGQRASS